MDDPLRAPTATGPSLPAGYAYEGELAAGKQGRVVRARLAGDPVVVRILAPDAGETGRRAELAVLAAVRHPGLASLVDHGVSADGRTDFVARSWIEGPDLLTYAASARTRGDLAAIGRVVARMCPALEELHRRGFVHADLKPTNVIVAAGDKPVITDFGLARSSAAPATSDALSGSLFALAPEQISGGPVDARTDLFALGVLLHQLLLARRTTASEFYARFPAEPFFDATGTRVDDLPDWARDVVARLVERAPSDRPASAGLVGRTLAGRLGLALSECGGAALPRIEWSAETGRATLLAGWIERVRAAWCAASERDASGERLSPQWWTFPAGEDPHKLVEAARVRLALAGCRTRRIESEEALRAVGSSAELDRWAGALASTSPGAVLFASLASDDHSALRAFDALARTIAQNQTSVAVEDDVLLVVAANAPPSSDSDVAWTELEIPAPSVADIERRLESELEDGPGERVQRFAALVAHAGAGSSSRIARVLHEAARDGWVLWGRERPRLRPGPLPERLSSGDSAHEPDPSLDDASRKLLAALHVGGGCMSVDSALELAALEPGAFGDALATLRARGLVAVENERAGVALEPLAPGVEPAWLALDDATWRAIHRRRAAALSAARAPPCFVLPHRHRADPSADVVGLILEQTTELRERGLPERALDLIACVLRFARESRHAVDARLVGDEAVTWAALGRPNRALEALRPIEDASEPWIVALCERVRGHVARLRHEYEVSFEHYARAARLDPDDHGDAANGKAWLLVETRRDAELAALLAEVESGALGTVSERHRANIENLHAMSLFRRGETAQAAAILARLAREARAIGDRSREAGIAINLATIARRTGDLAAAITHLESAVLLYEREGALAGLAQSLALLGSTLRESGELERAALPLANALAMRERLGDRTGATAVRGMLGLLEADRGHVHAALEELRRSAQSLRAGGRSIDAAVLEARADEVLARVEPRVEPGIHDGSVARAGVEPARLRAKTKPGEATLDADPRILVARARAAWLRADVEGARDYALRARDLSTRLGLAAPLAEARLLLAWLVHWARAAVREQPPAGGSVPITSAHVASAPLVRDDALVLATLSGDLRAPREAGLASELASRLQRLGRDDRAARLWLGIAARVDDPALAGRALSQGEELVRRCALGLDAAAAARLRGALLGMPDPWPADLEARRTQEDGGEGIDMDVVGLLEINHRLVQQDDLDTLLGTIVESALAVAGAERGFVVLEEDGELRFDSALDSRRGGIAAPDLEVSKSIVRQALDTLCPVRLSNAVDDPLLGDAPSVSALELRSILCVPFVVEASLRGVVYVDHRLRQGAFSERAERLVSMLADQAVLAIRQVRRVEEIRRLNRELNREVAKKESDLRTARAALREAQIALPPSGLVGSSPAMRAVHTLIERAAPTRLAVLVHGESGTGKELAARALHALSPRVHGPFVGENCAALPPSLIEAELFGAKKGAYTGSEQDRPGLFERADHGTLFLDEIGELPLELQAKLLRVLETGEVRRIGDSKVRPVDFRLVVATNRDLEDEVAAGRFRTDLYYRLDGLRVRLPPLSERVEDIPELVGHFLRLEGVRDGKERAIAPAVVARLCRRSWPGNVRELANEVARLCVLSEGDVVDPELVRAPSLLSGRAGSRAGSSAIQTLADLEREAIERAIEAAGGDKRKAAEMLGISRAKVYQRIKEWRSGSPGGDAGDDVADEDSS